MKWIFISNGLVIGACGGWVLGNYLTFGLAMTLVSVLLCGILGLGFAWWLERYWG